MENCQTSIVTYCKSDEYEHPVFVSTTLIHKKSFKTFSKLAKTLEDQFPDSYKNVYKNDNDVIYVKTSGYNTGLLKGCHYEIKWQPIVKYTKNTNKKIVVIKLYDITLLQDDETIFAF